MTDTKENILHTALELFARSGYEAVSVSAIAGALGMTKGALYKHYTSKRNIFDSILERMVQMDKERAKKYEVPEETFDKAPHSYRGLSTEKIRDFILSQFDFWNRQEFAINFRKLLTLEQYRNPEMADWYQKVFTLGPVNYLENSFREMMGQGLLKNGNPKQLALDFYAPFYLLLSISDLLPDKEAGTALFAAHLEDFMKKNEIQKK